MSKNIRECQRISENVKEFQRMSQNIRECLRISENVKEFQRMSNKVVLILLEAQQMLKMFVLVHRENVREYQGMLYLYMQNYIE